ncbi:MAG: hypothetical protein HQL31_09945, partial [Planctomycetes bacterium]|nr:hypothetical protein [Planctomycetota bacterium]
FMTRFDIDAAKCMYGGLCVEACNMSAIRHTSEFAGANPSVEALVLKFIPAGCRVAPRKPKDEVEARPRGSIVSGMIMKRAPDRLLGAK